MITIHSEFFGGRPRPLLHRLLVLGPCRYIVSQHGLALLHGRFRPLACVPASAFGSPVSSSDTTVRLRLSKTLFYIPLARQLLLLKLGFHRGDACRQLGMIVAASTIL